MALFGISTSGLKEKLRFDMLLGFEPQVIEFYNYPSAALPKIRAFCEAHRIVPALHTPTPYDGARPLRRFAPTGPDTAEIAQALRLTLDTINAAANMNALHVVVHFPTPYADVDPVIAPEEIDYFLGPVTRAAAECGVRLLIENMSSHPGFYKPSDYESLLDRYPDLEFCLDLGHAAQLGQDDAISDFVARLGTRIRSAHVYDWRPGTGHVHVNPSHRPEEGWIDIEAAVGLLSSGADIASWVQEPDPLDTEEMQGAWASMRWFRELFFRNQSPAEPANSNSDL